MIVDTVHNVIGWVFGNKLLIENRTQYHYDKGNDVTVVERRTIDIHLYDHRAVVPAVDQRGQVVDIKV